MNVILIGYRGTGKGMVGKSLAKRINFKFLDIDDKIEESTRLKIPEIFERFGEKHFRNLETKTIEEACSRNKYVLATGGGAPMRKKNVRAMKKHGVLILLTCSPEVIYSRIKGDKHRPALTNLDNEFKEVVFMLKERNLTYHAVADFSTDTSEKSVEENVNEIVGFLKTKGNL